MKTFLCIALRILFCPTEVLSVICKLYSGKKWTFSLIHKKNLHFFTQYNLTCCLYKIFILFFKYQFSLYNHILYCIKKQIIFWIDTILEERKYLGSTYNLDQRFETFSRFRLSDESLFVSVLCLSVTVSLHESCVNQRLQFFVLTAEHLVIYYKS